MKPGSTLNRMATCHPDRKHYGKSLCAICYEKQRETRKPAGSPCKICGTPSVARQLCEKHYRRLKKTGTTDSSSYGTHHKHELYERWRWTARTNIKRDPSWETFENFLEAVGTPPNLKYSLERLNTKEPWGPNNFVWVEPLELGVHSPRNRNEYAKEWRKARPHLVKNSYLKKRFGITLEDYEIKYEEQGGVCAICKQLETLVIRGKLYNLAVDHNHETGKIRELLCSRCNMMLGALEKNIELIEPMIDYIHKHND